MTAESPSPGQMSGANAIDAYIAANEGRFTDEALSAALAAAGHSPDAVAAGLARAKARSRTESPKNRPRAVRAVLIAYGVVFAILSVGMLLNTSPRGTFVPPAIGGIVILGMTLLVALALSAVWLATRRGFVVIVLIVVALGSVGALSEGGGVAPIALAVIVGSLGLAVVLIRSGSRGTAAAESALGVLLAVPVILLIAVAGLCVASGLPIPGGS
jgi:hypothetical protein